MGEANALDEYEPKILKDSPGDYTQALGLNMLGMVLSSIWPGAQLITAIVGVRQLSPMFKRLDKWMVQIQNAVEELRAQRKDIENLKDNDVFVTRVLQTTQIALHTHQQAKLDALRNAVLNSISASSPDEDLQHMFVQFIDVLTESHLVILKRFQNEPKTPGRSPLSANSGVTEKVLPQFAGRQEFIRQIIDDLQTRGLLKWDADISGDRIIQEKGYTTSLGDAFLNFITSPIDSNEQSED